MDAAALEEEIKVAGLMDLVIKYHADEKVQLQIHAWNLHVSKKRCNFLHRWYLLSYSSYVCGGA